jgi:arylsulfatase A-like enzyme
LTGQFPERHGVRTTAQRPGAVPGWAGATAVTANTLFDAAHAAGLRSAAILGDHHLHRVLRTAGAVDVRWPPSERPPRGTALDAHGYAVNAAVQSAALDAVADQSLDLVFVHFNELDTLGHDLGPEHPKTLDAIRATDALLGDFIKVLAPISHNTLVVVVSDHGMDNRSSEPVIRLRDDPRIAELTRDELADGGAAFLRPVARVDAAKIAKIACGIDGVALATPTADGLVLVGARPGRAFDANSCPVTGTTGGVHGGPSTIRTIAVVGGRHPAAREIGLSIAVSPPRLVDWAPTIAGTLGLRLEKLDGVILLPQRRRVGVAASPSG